MTRVLFVCEACGFSADRELYEGQPGGTHLLHQLMPLYENWARKSELEIQTVGCLCACERPRAIALGATNKITYLFGDLPPLESAEALLQLCELYLDSEDGYILPAKLPVSETAAMPEFRLFQQFIRRNYSSSNRVRTL